MPPHQPQRHLQRQPVRPRRERPGRGRTRRNTPTLPKQARSPTSPADPNKTSIGQPARREDYSRDTWTHSQITILLAATENPLQNLSHPSYNILMYACASKYSTVFLRIIPERVQVKPFGAA